MNAKILLISSHASESNTSTGYIIGAIIALVVLGYLIYALLKPEKF
ncbi:MAG: K(+)-transporting ATPase subunit F [Bacteroidales bacterium]|nr:K(+)-transporting ATPase subunit F [Bacteroidales bacterium]